MARIIGSARRCNANCHCKAQLHAWCARVNQALISLSDHQCYMHVGCSGAGIYYAFLPDLIPNIYDIAFLKTNPSNIPLHECTILVPASWRVQRAPPSASRYVKFIYSWISFPLIASLRCTKQDFEKIV